MLASYGGACTCCGERESRFLTIVADGSIDFGRSDIGGGHGGSNYFAALLRTGCPPEGLTCRCWNCDMAIQHDGACAHVRPRLPEGADASRGGKPVSQETSL